MYIIHVERQIFSLQNKNMIVRLVVYPCGRDKGSVIVYADNDINKVVQIDMKVQESILKFAEGDR